MNTVNFPSESYTSIPSPSELVEPRDTALSLSHHVTALEICDVVYGTAPSSWDVIERFYEPSATYENPFLVATSRAVIADIHSLASQFARLDIPKPVAVLFALFGMERTGRWKEPWFRAIRVWSDVGDVCESDSFDGHRKTIVEHTLNVLLFPGLHSSSTQPPTSPPHERALSTSDLSMMNSLSPLGQHTTLGLDLSIPSPFHLRLPIMTKLEFNDAGRITHHRDFWDVKDLLGLVPGMSLTQWITGRVFAQSIRGFMGISRVVFGSRKTAVEELRRHLADEEEGLSPAAAYAKAVKGTHHPQSHRSSRRVSFSQRGY